jgi:hypothetical protein
MMMDIMNEEIKNTVPRIQRSHFKKLKGGLKLVFDRNANIFKRLNENNITGNNDEERTIIEMISRCMTRRIKKHIAERIGKDPEKATDKGLRRKVNKRNPRLYEGDDIKEER